MIGYHFASGSDPRINGDRWLVERVATSVRRSVDVGANVGDWTMMLLACDPHACGIAVEPGPEAAVRLRNRVPHTVELVAALAGQDQRAARFYEQPGSGERSSVVADCAESTSGRTVASITIDELLSRYQWAEIDFLKIDTEGYNGRVIAGAAHAIHAHRIGLIQFEYNRPWRQAGHTLASVNGMLEASGYDVFVLREGGLEPYDYKTFGEFVSYANFVALSPTSAARAALQQR